MDKEKDKSLYNPDWDQHGYIQVYTGDGKGKTTASLGLAMRALGRDWKVLLIMFTKGGNKYGELNSFRNLSEKISRNLTIYQAGTEHIVYSDNITDEDKKVITDGWKLAQNAIKNNEYNLIILDELNIATALGIIDVDDVVSTIKNKPDRMEIVLTGRDANQKIIDAAHLVSKIEPVKHYWDIGVSARKGIEF